ncbi:MAG: SIS domain-containing protein [Jatrophihabitans sp.]|uniref:SIS domain-containing protein n=1 Tax=Jatrophihabitans sp. TaxID=1932789 RepID=UPI003915B2FA
MTTPGALMAAEIAEQPEALGRVLRDGRVDAARARSAIEKYRPRFVLLAARGTSDHAALYAKYLAEVELNLPAGLASASSFTVYGSRPDMTGVLFVAISQSGGSPDLVESMEVARGCGALTVAVTNNPASALAAAAEHHVHVHAGPERAVAATKTYTAELLALYLLLVGGDAAGVPEAAARTLAHGDAAVAAAGRFLLVDRLVTTARGFSYPTAREGALKLMETSYLAAQAFSGADLLHGPLAMLGPEVPVIAVTTTGRGAAALTPVLDRLAAAQVDVLRVGPPDGLPVVLDGVHESLAPVLEILPLQQLAWRLALDRGGDPDRPRGLSKVTETW